MITNAQLQAMIAVDRAALIELLAAFYTLGAQRGLHSDLWSDGDFRDLKAEVECFLRKPGNEGIPSWNRRRA